MSKKTRFIFKETVVAGGMTTACDFLASRTALSRSSVKDAMNKGALRVARGRGGMKRLRRATAQLKAGDKVEFYYDEELLSLKPAGAICIEDLQYYSVWYKPPGLLAQGTAFGDHCSLTRQAEMLSPRRPVFLVHRLDREAEGLMLLAHSRFAASKLSTVFRENGITKRYFAKVLGKIEEEGYKGRIELPLDGKEAITHFEVGSFDHESNTSSVILTIRTGRLHQIRRHMELIGHPVIGDPRYGKGNKNTEGMQLSAISLAFFCPLLKREVKYDLPPSMSSRHYAVIPSNI